MQAVQNGGQHPSLAHMDHAADLLPGHHAFRGNSAVSDYRADIELHYTTPQQVGKVFAPVSCCTADEELRKQTGESGEMVDSGVYWTRSLHPHLFCYTSYIPFTSHWTVSF